MVNEERRAPEYGSARITAALSLVGVVVFMLIVDAISSTYEADVLVVTAVLGAGATLLGVEVADIVRRNRT